MSEEINPYAAPQMVEAMRVVPSEGQLQGVWRWGKMLVMAKDAQLPPLCLKNGEPATRWLKRSLQWHHPAIAALVLIGLLPYVIIALIFTKRATIHVGMCEACFARRRRGIALAWTLNLSSVVLFVGSIFLVSARAWETVGVFSMIGSVLLFIGSIIYGVLSARLISPQRITERFVWLNGVHRSVLDQLPEWPRYE